VKKNEKKERKPKKLMLTRETLRSLDDEKMKEALGGAIQKQRDVPWTSDSVNVCCA